MSLISTITVGPDPELLTKAGHPETVLSIDFSRANGTSGHKEFTVKTCLPSGIAEENIVALLRSFSVTADECAAVEREGHPAARRVLDRCMREIRGPVSSSAACVL